MNWSSQFLTTSAEADTKSQHLCPAGDIRSILLTTRKEKWMGEPCKAKNAAARGRTKAVRKGVCGVFGGKR